MCFRWTLSSYISLSVVTVSWSLLALHPVFLLLLLLWLCMRKCLMSSLPLQPFGCTYPLTLGRKGTSREINLSLSLMLVPAAVAQPAGGPSLCPCSQFSWGQPAVMLFFRSCMAPLTSLSSLASPVVPLNPCWWFPISDSHPALVAPLDRRENFLLHGFLLSKYFKCMTNKYLVASS